MGNACCMEPSSAIASYPVRKCLPQLEPPRVPDWTEVLETFRQGTAGHPSVHERYVLERELGRGSFGVVRLAVRRSGAGAGERLACKTIPWSSLATPEAVEDLRREMSTMASLPRHAALVRLHEVYLDEAAAHLVMDLCDGGSLSDRITAQAYTAEDQAAAAVARQVVEVLRSLHAAGIMHRDLKPDNLMFTGNGDQEQLKVIDFGFAISFRQGETFRDTVGSLPFMAPEVFRRSYGPKADVWSAGVVIYQLLTGRLPFPADDDTYEGQRRATLRSAADVRWRRHQWSPLAAAVSDGAKDLVLTMLEPEPARRPTADQVLEHPWLRAPAPPAPA